ncbi:MAG TPA: prepilin-type N-terminal cleavage/methylation domain-containing protein [Blastocatellia bacterium]|jgi:hypothetical protein
MKETHNNQSGFTILEVAVASIITMIGLLALASLFTLAISQNKMIRQYTTTTALAQQKLEEINAVEKNDARLTIGGGLTEETKKQGYYDVVYVDPQTGTITTNLPQGATPLYARYWMVEPDPQLDRTVLISARVVALQPSQGRRMEETTLTTARSW